MVYPSGQSAPEARWKESAKYRFGAAKVRESLEFGVRSLELFGTDTLLFAGMSLYFRFFSNTI